MSKLSLYSNLFEPPSIQATSPVLSVGHLMMESQKAALWALLLLAIIQLLSHFVNAALFQPHATALRVDGNGDAFDAAADSRNGDELHFLNEQKIQNLTARQSRLASRGDEKRAAIPARMQGPRGRKPPARQRHTTAAPAIEETMAVTKEMLFDYSQIRVHACGRELMEEMLQSCYVFKIAIQQLNIHDLYLILGLERVEGTQSGAQI